MTWRRSRRAQLTARHARRIRRRPSGASSDIEPVFYEDDLEEFERNQLANDRAYERNDEAASSHEETEDFGDLID